MLFSNLKRLVRGVAVPSLGLMAVMSSAQLSVTTYHNDTLRTGLNAKETILKPTNVNQNTFGILFKLPTDGYVYAQPLYVQGVKIPGKGIYNVLYVATQHNTLYAFDADNNSGTNATPLWQVNFGPSVPNGDTGSGDITPEIGITSTPVIHTLRNGTQAIYVVAKTKTFDTNNNPVYIQKIHVLSIASGSELLKGPFIISGKVPGTGDASVNGVVTFDPLIQHARPALLMVPGPGTSATLYVTFASHGDNGPYHGWMFVYDAEQMKQIGIVNTTPNAKTDPSGYPLAAGGIWQGGSGPASDGHSIYFSTGNGTFDPTTKSYGDSILKFLNRSFGLSDYFTPSDQQALDDYDTDLGSGGVMLLPPSASGTSKKNLLVQTGKEGSIYLIDTAKMGKYSTTGTNNIVQELRSAIGGIWGAPAYFNNNVYFGPVYSSLVAFGIKNGQFTSTAPTSYSGTYYNYPGPTPSVSANGLTNGIVWAIQTDNWASGGPAFLQAFDALNLNSTLYDSSATSGRDILDGAVKFTTPTIVNGKVYVGTSDAVFVFGLGSWAATPSISSPSGTYTGTLKVTISDATPNAVIHYTIDGSDPTLSSPTYSMALSLNQITVLKAKAFFKDGSGGSGIAESDLLINASIGNGTGLTGNYYNATTSLSGTPVVTEIDPSINWNWNGNSPVAGVGGTNWSAEWTGSLLAETTATYTISTISDDGVMVYLNGNLIINDWNDHPPTTDTATVTLKAGQKYTIDIKYYQNGGGSLLQLYWMAPGIPNQIIPTTQLYSK